MHTRPIWLVAILFVVIVIAATYFIQTKKNQPVVPVIVLKNFDDCKNHGFPIIQTYPAQCTGPNGTIYFQDFADASSTATSSNSSATSSATSTATSTLVYKDQLVLGNLSENQVITSPLHIEGLAKGGWFFEGSFPIKIVDAKGKVLGMGPAQAITDWTSPGFVAFTADITFVRGMASTTASTTAFVILSKDNPSGLAKNADSFKIKVVIQ
jgi:hypothetical protein